jgi:hypothetical protein
MVSTGIKSCSKTSDSNLQREKEKGYNVGVLEGKKAAESDYTKKMEKLKNDYENLLEKNKNILEGKVTESYNQGVQQGIEKMTEEINSVMTIKTDNKKTKSKKTKQNWNEIISTGGE